LQKYNSYLLFSNVFRTSGFCCNCWKWWRQPDDEVQFQPQACQYLQYCSWRWWQQQLLFHYVMYSSSLKRPLSAVSFTICGTVHYLRYRSLSAVSSTICGIVHNLRYRPLSAVSSTICGIVHVWSGTRAAWCYWQTGTGSCACTSAPTPCSPPWRQCPETHNKVYFSNTLN